MPGLKLQDNAFDTALVLWPVTPISVLDKLRDVFRTVSFFPVQGPAAAPDAAQPSMDDYARADAIFAFSMPPELTHPDQTPRLKLFQCCSSGVSHLEGTDFFKAAQAERRDIAWANASGIQTTTIAEHVLGTVLMLTHKLAFLHLAAQNEQRWVPHAELGGNFIRELNTLVVGVIGYGNIGRETARLFRGCGATVVALTRHGVPQPATGYSLPSTGDPDGTVPSAYYSSTSREARHAFFGACDVVVNTLPESERTIGTMETDEFTAMKGDAIYVNVGRGTTTDQEALVRALTAQPQEGEERSATGTLRIGAASLDVVNPEPLPSSSPLYTLPNVILTPHMSALSAQYWSRAIGVLRTNVERLGRGEEGVNVFAGPGRESK
ncbi:hypothetical protein Rhopal_006234-T1 [Rhodotorula paludigena]|uniref:D-isomer specific 2-hydroxyacid dehydrogenase NAD-binding domain-containing protein n=1 Tax=Rhodotorula paludigena TaxID=86838 RepID=A0AAV5GVW7_9BASI|nr:hypothetical protein Rhopal_006234-T1 [Rhodotorula paludigena]